jgi:hypothetical protein
VRLSGCKAPGFAARRKRLSWFRAASALSCWRKREAISPAAPAPAAGSASQRMQLRPDQRSVFRRKTALLAFFQAAGVPAAVQRRRSLALQRLWRCSSSVARSGGKYTMRSFRVRSAGVPGSTCSWRCRSRRSFLRQLGLDLCSLPSAHRHPSPAPRQRSKAAGGTLPRFPAPGYCSGCLQSPGRCWVNWSALPCRKGGVGEVS